MAGALCERPALQPRCGAGATCSAALLIKLGVEHDGGKCKEAEKKYQCTCLVLAIVFCLALIASICTYFYAASGTEIFTKVGFGATLQNSRIMVDDENDMTFLGTYANTIIGVDAEGNHIWTQPISGAVGAMEYDTDNDWLIVGSQDRNVYVFNSLTGELLMQYPVNGKVDDLDYDQASKQILVSSGVSATKHTLAPSSI